MSWCLPCVSDMHTTRNLRPRDLSSQQTTSGAPVNQHRASTEISENACTSTVLIACEASRKFRPLAKMEIPGTRIGLSVGAPNFVIGINGNISLSPGFFHEELLSV